MYVCNRISCICYLSLRISCHKTVIAFYCKSPYCTTLPLALASSSNQFDICHVPLLKEGTLLQWRLPLVKRRGSGIFIPSAAHCATVCLPKYVPGIPFRTSDIQNNSRNKVAHQTAGKGGDLKTTSLPCGSWKYLEYHESLILK